MGDGVRITLNEIKKLIPINLIEYPSGSTVYDWTIPKEWDIKDAYIKDYQGNRLVDFNSNNLHVVNYSVPINEKMLGKELKDKIYTLESLPDAIPYRTSYYNDDWGFCMSLNQCELIKDDEIYEVHIDSNFSDGGLTIGELLIPGKNSEEVLISTYHCHPSMANDNLSGVVLTTFLAEYLWNNRQNLQYSYRILFVPETIGAISYCFHNENEMKAIDFGFVVTNVGGPGEFSYKQSVDFSHKVNEMVDASFNKLGINFKTYPFDVFGSDERQYSSQAFNINTVSICKDKYQEFDYYHTSLDNLDFVKPEYIEKSFFVYKEVLDLVDNNQIYKNKIDHGEVMLSKRGLYPKLSGMVLQPANKKSNQDKYIKQMLWLLFYSNGKRSLLEIAKLIDSDIKDLDQIAKSLLEKGVLTIEKSLS